jgi:hypothetical protein
VDLPVAIPSAGKGLARFGMCTDGMADARCTRGGTDMAARLVLFLALMGLGIPASAGRIPKVEGPYARRVRDRLGIDGAIIMSTDRTPGQKETYRYRFMVPTAQGAVWGHRDVAFGPHSESGSDVVIDLPKDMNFFTVQKLAGEYRDSLRQK